MTPALMLWLDAGKPSPAKPVAASDAPCYLCGEPSPTGTGVRVRDALGPGFTDHDQARCPSSSHVCVPCIYILGGKPPDTFRLWSVVYREDRLATPSNLKASYQHGSHTHCTSKSDVSEIVDILLAPPSGQWLCAVADSGQIHILPWSIVNDGSEVWTVRFERLAITSTPAEFAGVLYDVCTLLAAGYIRDDIETLRPHPSKLVKYGIAIWRAHASPLEKWRRSGLLALAIALTRKDTYAATRDRAEAVMDRRATGDDRPRPGACDDGLGDDGKDQSNGLVAAREVGPVLGSAESRDVGRAGHDDGAQASDRDAPRRVEQGDLFARAE